MITITDAQAAAEASSELAMLRKKVQELEGLSTTTTNDKVTNKNGVPGSLIKSGSQATVTIQGTAKTTGNKQSTPKKVIDKQIDVIPDVTDMIDLEPKYDDYSRSKIKAVSPFKQKKTSVSHNK